MLRMSSVAVEREALYWQVWSIPGARLALLYGISDVGLAKACKRYDIPRPPRGYWARLAAGQQVPKTPLPKTRQPDETVYIKGWHMADETIKRLIKEKASGPAAAKTIGGELHPLAAAAKAELLVAKPDHEGLVAAATTGPDIRVSPAAIGRSVAVLDALLKRWELRGGRCKSRRRS